MWRYCASIKEPEKKKSKTKENQAKYEETRKRKFQVSWLSNPAYASWLRYDEEQDLMFCRYCEKHGAADQVFVGGCKSHRVESLQKHVVSRGHVKSADTEKALSASPGTSQAEKMLGKLNALALARLDILFRNAHSLAKNHRPFTDFTWMCELDEIKGLDVGQNYRTDKKCREFTEAIGEVERMNLVERLESAKFFSIICDEATDCAVLEQLIIYLRYSEHGRVQTDFLSLETLTRANAVSCYQAILTALGEQVGATSEDVFQRLVGFASDGAAVMQGVRAGVAAKLKEKQPALTSVHCVAHRLELAIKNAVQRSPLHRKLGQFLDSLYTFYHNSTLNRGLLHLTASVLEVKRYVPTRVSGTRWVAHTETSLKNLFSGYTAIMQHLLEIKDDSKTSADSKGKSTGFVKVLQSRELMEFANFLADVLAVLARLSCSFQQRDLGIGEVPQLVEEAVTSPTKLKTRPGPNLRAIQKTPGYFQDRELDGEPVAQEGLDHCINALLDCLSSRMTTAGHLEATATITDFKKWPVEKEEDFGCAEVIQLLEVHTKLMEHAGYKVDAAEMEWDVMKSRIYKDFKPISKAKWCDVGVKYAATCPNFMGLIDLLLSIPATSVECERGFSLMKLVKSDWRSSLSTEVLTCLLRVILQGPTIADFDPLAAIELWNSSSVRSRRPFHAPYQQRSTAADDVVMVEDNE